MVELIGRNESLHTHFNRNTVPLVGSDLRFVLVEAVTLFVVLSDYSAPILRLGVAYATPCRIFVA